MPNQSSDLATFLKDALLTKNIVDQIGKESPKLALFLSTGRTDAQTGRAIPRTRDRMLFGGDKFDPIVRYLRNDARGTFKGWSLLNTTPNRKYDRPQFEWNSHYGVLPWNIEEFAKYRGNEEYISKLGGDINGLVADQINDLAVGLNNAAADQIGIQEFGMDGTGFLFDNTAAFGNVTLRSTTNSWWASQVDTTSYSAAVQQDPTHANYLPKLIDARRRAIFNSCGRYPTVLITSAVLYDRLHDIVQVAQRNVNTKVGTYGHEAIIWRGMEVYADAYLNSTNMEFYLPMGLDDQRNIGIVGRKGFWFDIGEWIDIPNQAGKLKKMYTQAAFYCTQPRMQAALTGLVN